MAYHNFLSFKFTSTARLELALLGFSRASTPIFKLTIVAMLDCVNAIEHAQSWDNPLLSCMELSSESTSSVSNVDSYIGVTVTQRFNYIEQPDILASFFWHYAHLNPCQRGYHTSVSPAPTVDLQDDVE